jgi:predicted nucleic acid-binding protein
MSSRRRAPARASEPDRAFVDSGAWLAFFSAADDNHARADTLIRRAAARRIRLLTTNLVVAETQRLLLFRAGPRAARAALDAIDASAFVRIIFPDRDRHAAARAWLARQGDQKISYADATSFAVMTAERCRVAISFDHDFWLAGFELWQA